MTIRPAVEFDLPPLGRLAAKLGAEPDEAATRALFASDRDQLLVAEEGGAVRALIHTRAEPGVFGERAVIAALVVDDESRGRGIGAALVEHARAWARDRGCTTLVVRTRVERERAHRFYDRLGFERVKTQGIFHLPTQG